MNRTYISVMVAMVVAVGWLGISKARAGDSNRFTDKQLEQARTVRTQRLKLGAEAVSALNDRNATAQAKTNAALAIGQLGYTPGIPVLIEQIDLRNPVGRTGESDIGSRWPCVRALADLGVAAVPALVEAYASETQKDRRELIHYAIIFGNAYSEAKTYTQGLLSQAKDPAHRKVLRELLKIIPEEEKADG